MVHPTYFTTLSWLHRRGLRLPGEVRLLLGTLQLRLGLCTAGSPRLRGLHHLQRWNWAAGPGLRYVESGLHETQFVCVGTQLI